MEREILFRGKNIDNGEWVYGDCVTIFDTKRVRGIETTKGVFEIYPETLGQYTGVDDCTGRKIFEGDLVKGFDSYTGEMYQDVTGLVKFYKGSFGAEWNNCFESFSITDDEIIVIGNIHDNPELMKGK